jgi:hypothetical protein
MVVPTYWRVSLGINLGTKVPGLWDGFLLRRILLKFIICSRLYAMPRSASIIRYFCYRDLHAALPIYGWCGSVILKGSVL